MKNKEIKFLIGTKCEIYFTHWWPYFRKKMGGTFFEENYYTGGGPEDYTCVLDMMYWLPQKEGVVALPVRDD